jgi:hypothetical protein
MRKGQFGNRGNQIAPTLGAQLVRPAYDHVRRDVEIDPRSRFEQVFQGIFRMQAELIQSAKVVNKVLQDLHSGRIHGRRLGLDLGADDHRQNEHPDRQRCCGLLKFQWPHFLPLFHCYKISVYRR